MKLLQLWEQKGMTPERLQEILTHGILADVFDPTAVLPDREELCMLLQLGRLVPELIILAVDYGLTLEQMIDAGNYNWKNDNLNAKNFKITGTGNDEWEFDLVDPKCNISSEDALKLLEHDSDPANPWIVGQTEHLLALGTAFPIVALGSVAQIRSLRRVPVLVEDGSRRCLDLYWFGDDWDANCRFLRVRKRKVSAPVASGPSLVY